MILWLPLALAAMAVLVLLVDILFGGARFTGALVAAGLSAVLVATFFVHAPGAYAGYENGPWALFFQRLFLCAGVLAALGAIDDVAARTPSRQGEYWMLLLFSLVGMSVLVGARDLVLLVVAFELMGIPLYVLAAYAKKGLASEAALKLYLVGATSSAITLFGLALVAGMTGTTRLDLLAAAPMTPLLAVGLLFLLGGTCYKIGIAPFHMWIPDTYQGASASFVAFLSVAPKAAGVAALSLVFLHGLAAHRAVWMPPLVALAIVSMAVGNVLALAQTDLRRLLGYSGIAQMGYVLVAVAASTELGMGMTLFFLAAYLFTNLGAFLVVHASGASTIDDLGGLSARSPRLAAALLCFILSLAGIPFVVGFWAKLYVFLAAWKAGLGGVVVVALALAVLSLFYYLRVLRAAYMTDGRAEAPRSGPPLRAAIALCALAVIALGLYPRPLVEDASRAGRDLFSHTK